VGAWHPFNAYQTVIMTLKHKDALLNVRVPNKHIVIQACTKYHAANTAPIKGVNTLSVSKQGRFRLQSLHIPQTDFLIATSRRQQLHLFNRKQIHNLSVLLVMEVDRVYLRLIVTISDTEFFHLLDIVSVNHRVNATCEKLVDLAATPFN
jgi:hypothetical protein